MVTVSLQPFAFRKIALVAALIWLTSALVFADPVFMNVHRSRFAQAAVRTQIRAQSARGLATLGRAPHTTVEQSSATPAEGPAMFSVSSQRLETWSIARRAATDAADLTFWSIWLAR